MQVFVHNSCQHHQVGLLRWKVFRTIDSEVQWCLTDIQKHGNPVAINLCGLLVEHHIIVKLFDLTKLVVTPHLILMHHWVHCLLLWLLLLVHCLMLIPWILWLLLHVLRNLLLISTSILGILLVSLGSLLLLNLLLLWLFWLIVSEDFVKHFFNSIFQFLPVI